jgi:hypothetical protein
MGRIKSGRATIDRRDLERLPHVEDQKFAPSCFKLRRPQAGQATT